MVLGSLKGVVIRMPSNEIDLKKHLKEQPLARVYFLYGEESYLTSHYASLIAGKAVGKDDLSEFNLHKFDGQTCTPEELEDAAEALPLMAERTCVVVRDYDITTGGAAAQERVMALVSDPPESCVMVFWVDAVVPDLKKNAKWKAFAAAIEKNGVSVDFPRKSNADIVRMLCAGAAKRGNTLRPEDARLLVEQCGDELNLLLNELDKLCGLAGEGEITKEHIETAATHNLEASVFDLSKALLQNNYTRAYTCIHRLFAQREEPVSILAVLSSSYVDLYRAKVAVLSGKQADSLAADFAYRGKEFRLRNAARDCSRLSLPMLRKSLNVLADADIKLKSSRIDKRVVLEQTAAQLIVIAKTGG